MADRALLRELGLEWGALRTRLAAEPAAARADRDGPRFPVSPLALYAQLEEIALSWRELRGEPLEALQGRYVNAAWTLKDVLGHLASWAAEFRGEIETVVAGGRFDYAIPYALSVMGPNEWNAGAAAEQAPRDLGTILEEFEAETSRVQDLVLALPENVLYGPAAFPLAPTGDPSVPWRGNIAQIVLGKCQHDRHHLDQVRKWLERVKETR